MRVKKTESFMQNKGTFVSLFLEKSKRYYEKVKEKSVINNKLFWKAVKSFSSDKIVGKNKIHLAENGELMKTGLENAEILNDFFFKHSTKAGHYKIFK